MKYNELVKAAIQIKVNSYSPYSKFKVGAAVMGKNGKTYLGVNVENTSYGATNCAERTAIYNAITDGETNITAITIASDDDNFIYPCGICRQVIAEFADDNIEIICSRRDGKIKVYKLKDLLPHRFKV